MPDVVTDQTVGARRADRLRPRRPVARRGRRAARVGPGRLRTRDRSPRWAGTSRRCSSCKRRGAIVFDYGNNIRAQAVKAGVDDAFRHSRLRARVHSAALLRRQGPVPLGRAVGRPRGHLRDRSRRARDVRRRRAAVPLDSTRGRAREVSGTAGAHFLARLRRPRALRSAHQRAGAAGRDQGADRHRPRSSRHRLGRLAQPRDRRHARRQRRDRRLADSQRAAQRLGRRDVGVGASRRRRRHRLLDSCRHGDRRRRLARSRRTADARAHVRSRASASRGTPMPGIPKRCARPRQRGVRIPMVETRR